MSTRTPGPLGAGRLTVTIVCALLASLGAQPRAGLPPGDLALSFEENHGQADPQVRYLARRPGGTILLTHDEAVVVVPEGGFRLRFVGARSTEICGRERMPGRVSYFRGGDPDGWVHGAPTYGRVAIPEVYPGIGLVYYGSQGGNLEFDLEVSPGADPAQIELEIEGAVEARLDRDGGLVLDLGGADAVLRAPVAYQGSTRIESRFRIHEDESCPDSVRVTIELAEYDSGRALVIDPVLGFSTYLGGDSTDVPNGIALDDAGNIYVVGRVESTDFPTAGALQPTYGGGNSDGFVTKIDPATGTLIYSTYLGGSSLDRVLCIAVDAAGNAYLAGHTSSPDFPLVNPFQGAVAGNADAFYAKLDPTGTTLLYSTLHGGSDEETPIAIAIDTMGRAMITGETWSLDFPTASPLQAASGGSLDSFVAKVNAGGSALVFSTYLGGSDDDLVKAMHVDAAGYIHLAGETWSTDYPTVSAFQNANAGECDAFLSRLNSSGSTLAYSTYLGGTLSDIARGLTVDAGGSVYLTGQTLSGDFPTLAPLQATVAGSYDCFVSRFDPAGTALVFSTYLGGTGSDSGRGIQLDEFGEILLAGSTTSADFPTVAPMQAALSGARDAIFVRLDASASSMLFSTYFGGSGQEGADVLFRDDSGRLYSTAMTTSTDLPLAQPAQALPGGLEDAMVLRLDPELNIRTVTPGQGTVTLGESGVAVAVDVENIGPNDVQIDTADLTFTDSVGADLGADYTVMPAPGNPTVLVAGATETLDFSVHVAVVATVCPVTIGATVTATDLVTSAPLGDARADTFGSWEVVQCQLTLCGDCNSDGGGTILDSLAAAQHAVGIIVLDDTEFSNCNVAGAVEPDPGAVIDILDALVIAQDSAGLPVALVCCL